MMYGLLKNKIKRGSTKDLKEKLKVFYANKDITKAEYKELLALLAEKEGT